MNENRISLLDTLQSAFYYWRRYFLKIAVVGFIVYLPSQVCIEFVSIKMEEVFPADDPRPIYMLIRFLIDSIALLGITNFIVRKLDNDDSGKDSVSDILLLGIRKWPRFIGVSFLAGLRVLAYTFLLIIPGIYKAVRLSFFDCVVSTTDNIFTDPCSESERLVENNWWKVFGLLLLIVLLQILLEFSIIIPLFFYTFSSIISVAFLVVISILETYFIVLKANYYFNIKKMKGVQSLKVSDEEPVNI